MSVIRPKTQFMYFAFEQNEQCNIETVNNLGDERERFIRFKYTGMSVEEECGIETEITKRVGAGWRNWNK